VVGHWNYDCRNHQMKENSCACGNHAFPRWAAGRHPSHWVGGYHTRRKWEPSAQLVFLEGAAVHLEEAAIPEINVEERKMV